MEKRNTYCKIRHLIFAVIHIAVWAFLISCTNNQSSKQAVRLGSLADSKSDTLKLSTSTSDNSIITEGLKQGNMAKNSNIEYARYFHIMQDSCAVKRLIVKNRWSGKEKDDVYTLVPRDFKNQNTDAKQQGITDDIYTIHYPVKKVVCMSSSHVAYLAELGEHECIKGISGTKFITNEKVRGLIKENRIADVGGENLPDYELIISMKPDVVIAYGINGGNNSHIEKLQQFGIKALTIGDYLEDSPLGKLEYLKLFGELTQKREIADSIFIAKAQRYIDIKTKIASAIEGSDTTDVLLNAPYNGIWYIPGDKNYTSQLIKDAGGKILGAKEDEIQPSQLSFEHVYQFALKADVWLHPNIINTLKALEAENPLFKNIPALKNNRVYNNTLRNTPEGGSDFWETGVVEPHIILEEIAHILHPELFTQENFKFKYYRRLK